MGIKFDDAYKILRSDRFFTFSYFRDGDVIMGF